MSPGTEQPTLPMFEDDRLHHSKQEKSPKTENEKENQKPCLNEHHRYHILITMSFGVKLLSEFAVFPRRATSGSAGYDLSSACNMVVPSRGRSLIMTDVTFEIPWNYYGRIASRSGIAVKHGIDVGAGVIDSDYRGNIGVLLFNHGDDDFNVKAGDRIAQIIFERITNPCFMENDLQTYTHVSENIPTTKNAEQNQVNVSELERGNRGFGSSGIDAFSVK